MHTAPGEPRVVATRELVRTARAVDRREVLLPVVAILVDVGVFSPLAINADVDFGAVIDVIVVVCAAVAVGPGNVPVQFP